MKTVSAAMIIQDEEDIIRYSIYNPLLILDEIFIVDGGSKDNTLKIVEQTAKELGMEHKLKIHYNKFKDLSSQRNYYLQHIKTDFIWYIDSDECYHVSQMLRIKNKYINEYNCILIKSWHYYIDFFHYAYGNSWNTSYKMPKVFSNIVGHMKYTDYIPNIGDHDLRIDGVPYFECWKGSMLLCDINDIACYHLSHALGKEKEHEKIKWFMKYDHPEQCKNLSEEELNERAWQSSYFDKRFWEDGVNADTIGIKKFEWVHPTIMKEHPLYGVRIIKD